MGEMLTLSGTVENWEAGRTAEVHYGPAHLGTVQGDGTLTVAAPFVPFNLFSGAEEVLLPSVIGADCALDTVTVSNRQARAEGLVSLPLGLAPTPQTSPAPPMPMLLRRQGETRVVLVYVDRDVRVSGQKSCTGESWSWSPPPTSWARSAAINVFLRKGWNTVSITEKDLGENRRQLVVQGGDTEPPTPWRFSFFQ